MERKETWRKYSRLLPKTQDGGLVSYPESLDFGVLQKGSLYSISLLLAMRPGALETPYVEVFPCSHRSIEIKEPTIAPITTLEILLYAFLPSKLTTHLRIRTQKQTFSIPITATIVDCMSMDSIRSTVSSEIPLDLRTRFIRHITRDSADGEHFPSAPSPPPIRATSPLTSSPFDRFIPQGNPQPSSSPLAPSQQKIIRIAFGASHVSKKSQQPASKESSPSVQALHLQQSSGERKENTRSNRIGTNSIDRVEEQQKQRSLSPFKVSGDESASNKASTPSAVYPSQFAAAYASPSASADPFLHSTLSEESTPKIESSSTTTTVTESRLSFSCSSDSTHTEATNTVSAKSSPIAHPNIPRLNLHPSQVTTPKPFMRTMLNPLEHGSSFTVQPQSTSTTTTTASSSSAEASVSEQTEDPSSLSSLSSPKSLKGKPKPSVKVDLGRLVIPPFNPKKKSTEEEGTSVKSSSKSPVVPPLKLNFKTIENSAAESKKGKLDTFEGKEHKAPQEAAAKVDLSKFIEKDSEEEEDNDDVDDDDDFSFDSTSDRSGRSDRKTQSKAQFPSFPMKNGLLSGKEKGSDSSKSSSPLLAAKSPSLTSHRVPLLNLQCSAMSQSVQRMQLNGSQNKQNGMRKIELGGEGGGGEEEGDGGREGRKGKGKTEAINVLPSTSTSSSSTSSFSSSSSKQPVTPDLSRFIEKDSDDDDDDDDSFFGDGSDSSKSLGEKKADEQQKTNDSKQNRQNKVPAIDLSKFIENDSDDDDDDDEKDPFEKSEEKERLKNSSEFNASSAKQTTSLENQQKKEGNVNISQTNKNGALTPQMMNSLSRFIEKDDEEEEEDDDLFDVADEKREKEKSQKESDKIRSKQDSDIKSNNIKNLSNSISNKKKSSSSSSSTATTTSTSSSSSSSSSSKPKPKRSAGMLITPDMIASGCIQFGSGGKILPSTSSTNTPSSSPFSSPFSSSSSSSSSSSFLSPQSPYKLLPSPQKSPSSLSSTASPLLPLHLTLNTTPTAQPPQSTHHSPQTLKPHPFTSPSSSNTSSLTQSPSQSQPVSPSAPPTFASLISTSPSSSSFCCSSLVPSSSTSSLTLLSPQTSTPNFHSKIHSPSLPSSLQPSPLKPDTACPPLSFTSGASTLRAPVAAGQIWKRGKVLIARQHTSNTLRSMTLTPGMRPLGSGALTSRGEEEWVERREWKEWMDRDSRGSGDLSERYERLERSHNTAVLPQSPQQQQMQLMEAGPFTDRDHTPKERRRYDAAFEDGRDQFTAAKPLTTSPSSASQGQSILNSMQSASEGEHLSVQQEGALSSDRRSVNGVQPQDSFISPTSCDVLASFPFLAKFVEKEQKKERRESECAADAKMSGGVLSMQQSHQQQNQQQMNGESEVIEEIPDDEFSSDDDDDGFFGPANEPLKIPERLKRGSVAVCSPLASEGATPVPSSFGGGSGDESDSSSQSMQTMQSTLSRGRIVIEGDTRIGERTLTRANSCLVNATESKSAAASAAALSPYHRRQTTLLSVPSSHVPPSWAMFDASSASSLSTIPSPSSFSSGPSTPSSSSFLSARRDSAVSSAAFSRSSDRDILSLSGEQGEGDDASKLSFGGSDLTDQQTDEEFGRQSKTLHAIKRGADGGHMSGNGTHSSSLFDPFERKAATLKASSSAASKGRLKAMLLGNETESAESDRSDRAGNEEQEYSDGNGEHDSSSRANIDTSLSHKLEEEEANRVNPHASPPFTSIGALQSQMSPFESDSPFAQRSSQSSSNLANISSLLSPRDVPSPMSPRTMRPSPSSRHNLAWHNTQARRTTISLASLSASPDSQLSSDLTADSLETSTLHSAQPASFASPFGSERRNSVASIASVSSPDSLIPNVNMSELFPQAPLSYQPKQVILNTLRSWQEKDRSTTGSETARTYNTQRAGTMRRAKTLRRNQNGNETLRPNRSLEECSPRSGSGADTARNGDTLLRRKNSVKIGSSTSSASTSAASVSAISAAPTSSANDGNRTEEASDANATSSDESMNESAEEGFDDDFEAEEVEEEEEEEHNFDDEEDDDDDDDMFAGVEIDFAAIRRRREKEKAEAMLMNSWSQHFGEIPPHLAEEDEAEWEDGSKDEHNESTSSLTSPASSTESSAFASNPDTDSEDGHDNPPNRPVFDPIAGKWIVPVEDDDVVFPDDDDVINERYTGTADFEFDEAVMARIRKREENWKQSGNKYGLEDDEFVEKWLIPVWNYLRPNHANG